MHSFVEVIVNDRRHVVISGRRIEEVDLWRNLNETIAKSVLRATFGQTFAPKPEKPTPSAIFVVETVEEGRIIYNKLKGYTGNHIRIFRMRAEDDKDIEIMLDCQILILLEIAVGLYMLDGAFNMDKCRHFVVWYLKMGGPVGTIISLVNRPANTRLCGVILLTDANNARMAKSAMENLWRIGPNVNVLTVFLPVIIVPSVVAGHHGRRPAIKECYEKEFLFLKSVVLCKSYDGAGQLAMDIKKALSPSRKPGAVASTIRRFNNLDDGTLCILKRDTESLDFRKIEAFVNYDESYCTWALGKLGAIKGYVLSSIFIEDLPVITFE